MTSNIETTKKRLFNRPRGSFRIVIGSVSLLFALIALIFTYSRRPINGLGDAINRNIVYDTWVFNTGPYTILVVFESLLLLFGLVVALIGLYCLIMGSLTKIAANRPA